MTFYCSVGLLRKIYILGFPRNVIWGNIDGSNLYIDPWSLCVSLLYHAFVYVIVRGGVIVCVCTKLL
jgi:hypothetical protein